MQIQDNQNLEDNIIPELNIGIRVHKNNEGIIELFGDFNEEDLEKFIKSQLFKDKLSKCEHLVIRNNLILNSLPKSINTIANLRSIELHSLPALEDISILTDQRELEKVCFSGVVRYIAEDMLKNLPSKIEKEIILTPEEFEIQPEIYRSLEYSDEPLTYVGQRSPRERINVPFKYYNRFLSGNFLTQGWILNLQSQILYALFNKKSPLANIPFGAHHIASKGVVQKNENSKNQQNKKSLKYVTEFGSKYGGDWIQSTTANLMFGPFGMYRMLDPEDDLDISYVMEPDPDNKGSLRFKLDKDGKAIPDKKSQAVLNFIEGYRKQIEEFNKDIDKLNKLKKLVSEILDLTQKIDEKLKSQSSIKSIVTELDNQRNSQESVDVYLQNGLRHGLQDPLNEDEEDLVNSYHNLKELITSYNELLGPSDALITKLRTEAGVEEQIPEEIAQEMIDTWEFVDYTKDRKGNKIPQYQKKLPPKSQQIKVEPLPIVDIENIIQLENEEPQIFRYINQKAIYSKILLDLERRFNIPDPEYMLTGQHQDSTYFQMMYKEMKQKQEENSRDPNKPTQTKLPPIKTVPKVVDNDLERLQFDTYRSTDSDIFVSSRSGELSDSDYEEDQIVESKINTRTSSDLDFSTPRISNEQKRGNMSKSSSRENLRMKKSDSNPTFDKSIPEEKQLKKSSSSPSIPSINQGRKSSSTGRPGGFIR